MRKFKINLRVRPEIAHSWNNSEYSLKVRLIKRRKEQFNVNKWCPLFGY